MPSADHPFPQIIPDGCVRDFGVRVWVSKGSGVRAVKMCVGCMQENARFSEGCASVWDFLPDASACCQVIIFSCIFFAGS